MKSLSCFLPLTILLVCLSFFSARAGLITFENMPEDFWLYAGNQNSSTYWEGVSFGPEVTILSSSNNGLNPLYPAHSGDAVLCSMDIPYIDATFEFDVDAVSFWYTSKNPLFVDAFDEAGNLLSTSVGSGNFTADENSSQLTINSPEVNIRSIRIYDYVETEESLHDFVIDDFEVAQSFVSGKPRLMPKPVPEPGSGTLFIIGFSGLIGLALKKRTIR
jgi:hypothetical protein